MSGSQVQDLEIPKESFWMEPYIPKHGIVLAHGRFSTFKTPFFLNIAKAISSGQPEVFGCRIEQARCLFVQADMPKFLQVQRAQILGVGVPLLDFAFIFPGFNILKPAESELELYYYQLMSKVHRANRYDVVFIDSLRAIHGADDKESQTPHEVYRALQKLFLGATIVIVHHDAKFSIDRNPNESFSGSQAWMNQATVGLKFSLLDEKQGEVKVEHTKSQASELQPPLLVKFTEGILGKPLAEAKADEVKSYIHQILLEDPELDKREIDAKVADYFGISERTARRRRLDCKGEPWAK